MRKYAMKVLEILHGGMLLAAIYCIVMQQVTDDIRMLLRGLYLLIPCAVLSVAAARVRKFWQFSSLHWRIARILILVVPLLMKKFQFLQI